VLISYGLWQRRFGSDPDILGKPITLAQEAYTIIGVMPAEYSFPFAGIDVWATKLMNYSGVSAEQIRNGAGYLTSIARLKPGVTVSQADAEVAVLNKQYRQEHPGNPDADPHGRLDVEPLQENLVTGIRSTLWILTGAVGFVLLIACANVASLMLARATGRAREIVIRAALGANRSTLVRQLLVESLLLSGVGATLGVMLASWGVALLVPAAGGNLPGFQPIRVDLRVLAFTLSVSILSGILFGLVPALQVSRPNLNGVLRDSGWGTTSGASRHRTRSLLVAGQMALSIVLLIGAGLLIESFRQLQNVKPGFDPTHALTMRFSMPPAKYPDDARRAQFVREVVDHMETLPGVSSVSASLGMPLVQNVMAPYLADGQPAVPMGQRPLATWNAISPEYFKTLGIPLIHGRDFTWADDEKAPRRVIVSQSLARRWWPNDDAVGKHIIYARRQVDAEIVGVAGDVKSRGLDSEPGMVFYTPYPQFAWANMSISLRTAGDPLELSRSARAQISALDRDLPVVNIQSVEDVVGNTLSQRRQTMYLIAGFALIALLLAVVGLYGVMAYSVVQRTTEIGIRQAIGAQRSDILRMVLSQGVRLSLAGIAAGTVVAVLATRLISGMLFHVSATDPVTFAAIAILFLIVALAASCIPAFRATRVDPLEALRHR
jgi:predicted permease